MKALQYDMWSFQAVTTITHTYFSWKYNEVVETNCSNLFISRSAESYSRTVNGYIVLSAMRRMTYGCQTHDRSDFSQDNMLTIV